MNELLILCTSEGLPTAKLLLTQINDASVVLAYPVGNQGQYRGIKVVNGELQKLPISKTLPQARRMLRWGNRNLNTPDGTVCYNHMEALNKSAHKFRARQLFLGNGIPCPKMVTPGFIQPAQYPVICRPHQHKAGEHFGVIKDYGTFQHQYIKLKNTHYFSEFINKTQEFRVHCAHGKIMAISEKPKPENPNLIPWNHATNGDEFRILPWHEFDMGMVKASLNAVKLLGLDFGAVDVIVKDGSPYVLEVNSAPSLLTTEYMTDKYVRYIKWILNSAEPREHFPFEKYEKIESFPWKDCHFEDRPPVKGKKNVGVPPTQATAPQPTYQPPVAVAPTKKPFRRVIPA